MYRRNRGLTRPSPLVLTAILSLLLLSSLALADATRQRLVARNPTTPERWWQNQVRHAWGPHDITRYWNGQALVDGDCGECFPVLGRELRYRSHWSDADPSIVFVPSLLWMAPRLFEPGGVYRDIGQYVAASCRGPCRTGEIQWQLGLDPLNSGKISLQFPRDVLAAPSLIPQEQWRPTGLGLPRPNPFQPRTTIPIWLSRPGEVSVTVYDVAGRRVGVLLRGSRNAGHHSVGWDGLDLSGRPVASGVYLIRLKTRDTTQMRRVMRIRS